MDPSPEVKDVVDIVFVETTMTSSGALVMVRSIWLPYFEACREGGQDENEKGEDRVGHCGI